MKIPQYKQEIKKIIIDKELFDELEWEFEQIKQEKESVELEIKNQNMNFEEIKKRENSKFNLVKAEYDRMLEEEVLVDNKIKEFDESAKKIVRKAELNYNVLYHKVEELNRKHRQLHHIVNTFKSDFEKKKDDNIYRQEKAKKEYQTIKNRL